jgi:hypothetical protein
MLLLRHGCIVDETAGQGRQCAAAANADNAADHLAQKGAAESGQQPERAHNAER